MLLSRALLIKSTGNVALQQSTTRSCMYGVFMHSRGMNTSTDGSKPSEKSSESKPNAAGPEDANENAKPTDDANPEESKLKTRVNELEAQLKEKQDDLLRAYAEMENVRQRATKDVSNAQIYATQKFSKSLLDVADNLGRALESVPEEKRNDENCDPHLKSIYEGVSMTHIELIKVFTANGIVSFGEIGEKFDPHKHDAMFNVPNPNMEAGTIAQVLKRGYMFKDRVLRPAQVGTVTK